jgi:hypothetical protein
VTISAAQTDSVERWDLRIMNLQELGGKRSWPNLGHCSDTRLEGPQKSTIRVVTLWTEIWTRGPPKCEAGEPPILLKSVMLIILSWWLLYLTPRRPGFKPGSGHVGFCDGQKWRWGRFSPRTSGFPANLHSICFSTIFFTITRGWHNRPGVAAVPIASQTK